MDEKHAESKWQKWTWHGEDREEIKLTTRTIGNMYQSGRHIIYERIGLKIWLSSLVQTYNNEPLKQGS